jgi:hypothetical protein
MAAGHGGLDRRALFDAKHRRMIQGGVGDAQAVQEGEQMMSRDGLIHVYRVADFAIRLSKGCR